MTTVTFTSSGSWTAPGGLTVTDCQCWAEGGNGGTGTTGTGSHSGGGGGGGEYAEEPTLAITGGNNYSFTIGSGGSGNNTSFPGDSVTVLAHRGTSAGGVTHGTGGTGSTNSIHNDGGSGGNGITHTNPGGGGGGGGAGSGGAGGTGAGGGLAGNASGGSGGAGGGGAGGQGGSGSITGNPGQDGSTLGGGGGGGSGRTGGTSGGNGAGGQISLTYTATVSGTATLSGVGTLSASSLVFNPSAPVGQQPVAPGKTWLRRFGYGRRQILPGRQVQTITAPVTPLAGVGSLSAYGAPPNPVVVNQWANGYGQAPVFGGVVPAQSCVVSLTPAGSVGPGSGTPTAGNWLFTIVSWTQDPQVATIHTSTGDDIHSWWREFPASNSSGNVRTSVSYTPNIARTVGNVYVAPDAELTAINVLVVEVSGLGPWDTVVGTNANYAASATSLSLSQAANAAGTFFIAGIGGDNTTSGQAFLPAGWQALATVTQTNGTDHTTDNILTSAFLPAGTVTQNVSGSASSAEDMSGFILAVRVSGLSPIPASQNPNWPYVIFEAGFGSGFNTPDSEITWTDLSGRMWDWRETTGIQFQLGSIQATELEIELDNFDGNLTPSNTASPYYPNMIPGTPLRFRAAIGTLGGVTLNRWYIFQRNAMQWTEAIRPDYRRQVTVSATDLWAAMSSVPPTFYRAEIYADSPYAWWPMDDQALEGGVLPTSLLNAASGNTATMSIVASPNGVSGQDAYSTSGAALSAAALQCPPPGVATYSVGANSGWMYGDPASSVSSLAAATGNPVEPSAGSASWQQSGALGSGGANGWFLSYNDTGLPGLSGGITVKGWFNALFFGTSSGYQPISGTRYVVAGQPYSVLTVCTLATSSAPVAILQLDLNGHLNLITYNGTTGTSQSIYSASDLRSQTWVSVDITLTTTTWNVLVNGGLTANVSGSATGMTSAWTYLILNGDMGTSGGASPSAIQHGGNVAYSHWTVFPYILPAWKLLNHYTAAITGFGLLPPPLPSAQLVFDGNLGTGTQHYALPPDGSTGPSPNAGSYGAPGGNLGSATTFTFSALAVTNAGSYTSGPSPRATIAGAGQVISGQTFGYIVWTSWTGTAPYFTVYTSSSVDNETAAATAAGSGDSFTSGYGSGASGHGVCQTGGGSGASPPASATALGDTVGQRIERLMKAGRTSSPSRNIDPAGDLVQAPGTSGGGTQLGAAIQAIQQSDGGLLFIDNCNRLNYWQRSHLAAQYSSPVWTITPNAPPTPGAPLSAIPYYRDVNWVTDPQRVWNVIEVAPFSPSGAQLPVLTPAAATTAQNSQQQYGAQALNITSWLQNQATMQSQANWLLSVYGTARRRMEGVKIDAAAYPAAFGLVMGINVGDVVTVQDWQLGNTGPAYTYRVSEIRRVIVYGEEQETTEASVTLTLDYEPPNYYGVSGYTDLYTGNYS